MKVNKEIFSILRAIVHSSPSDSRVLPMAVAKAVGYRLALPTTKVANEREWYQNAASQDVDDIVNEINERLVIPVMEVRKLIFGVWRMRYRMVHNTNAIPNNVLFAAMGNAVISQDSLDVMNKVPDSTIRSMVNCMEQYIEGSENG